MVNLGNRLPRSQKGRLTCKKRCQKQITPTTVNTQTVITLNDGTMYSSSDTVIGSTTTTFTNTGDSSDNKMLNQEFKR